MKLPNLEFAYIPLSKLKGYLLSETHAVGRSKAMFFRMAGYDESNLDLFEQGLIAIAQTEEVKEEVSSPHGMKYVIDGTLKAPIKSVSIRTVWIIDKGQDRPRFITAFPIELRSL